MHEVGIIAHSCGVSEPRHLRRYHARVTTGDGKSVALNELFPDATPLKGETALSADKHAG